MSKRPPHPDQLNFDGFFKVPRAPERRAGSLGFDGELRNALGRAIKESPRSRAEIVAAMTDLIFGDADDGEVTKHQIDAWTAPSRSAWAFPLKYLPAFVEATGAIWLLDLVAEKCGCSVLVGEQALLAELGALILQEKQVRRRKVALQQAVPPEILDRLVRQAGGES